MSATLSQSQWITRFASAWLDAAKGEGDIEILTEQAYVLHRVLGDQPPEQIARKHFDNCPKPEQRIRQPEKEFTELAANLGLIKDGDRLDANMMAFAHAVAEKCALIGDRYGSGRNFAGDHIRGLYGALPAWPRSEEPVPF